MGIERFLSMPKFARLVELEPTGRKVFVGDTHGDLEASENVFDRFLDDRTTLIFLGDYVDRGSKSAENVEFLFNQMERNPKQVYLLQGNHEGFKYIMFQSRFWFSLGLDCEKYCELFSKLPLAVSVGDIIGTHGGLPELENLADINNIQLGYRNWQSITWGDWEEKPGKFLWDNEARLVYGEDHFNDTMAGFEKKLLIRSHDRRDPVSMYNEQLITIFTTKSYGDSYSRRVAVADYDRNSSISNFSDLEIVDIDF